MKYLEWNNLISAYFFNPDNAGKEVHLYLTKNDIIGLGKPYFTEETEEEVWNDFVKSIILGIPISTGNLIAKAKHAYSKSNLVGRKKSDGTWAAIEDVPILYPPYIAYLVFFVLPLIETDVEKRANNYYGRLNSFLTSNQINERIGTADFSGHQINSLWEDLSNWANIKNQGDFGMFNLTPFTNANWIYVGKVFSQCIFPPKFLNRLPELFESIGLVPDTFYEDDFLKDKIKNSKTDLIPKSTLEFLKEDDELSNSIIQTIQRQYKNWTGETHEEVEEGVILTKKRNYTVAPLFLQFKVNANDEEIRFSYRMRSSNDYPEDLKFDDFQNIYEINGWSKTLHIDFKEGVELKDKFNKWIAKFPERDVRLFVSAGTFQLSNDFWIETDMLSKTERMYLLCKIEKQESIIEWGKTFSGDNFKQEDFEGLPENYSLFWFRNPTQGFAGIPILTLYNEKRVQLVGGLKVNFRTYINDYLPEVEIVNSDGNEKVYLQYKGAEDKIVLSKNTRLNNRWLLPEKIELHADFKIKVENENFAGNEFVYNIVISDNTATKVDGSKLPKRDSFGRNTSIDVGQFCLGSNIINPNVLRQEPYVHLFRSTMIDTSKQIHKPIHNNHSGNKLASYLSLRSFLTTEDFFRAFEYYYSKEFTSNETVNLTKQKRASLSFYDFIGILDYDYETKSIVLNSPQFIFIPATKGRKVLLIGARDSALIETIIEKAPSHNLEVEITTQFASNARLLLPDVITIKAFQQQSDTYGEMCLKAFADELGIKFSNDYFPQVALQDFSSNIDDYEKILEQIDENDYDWARYIFNPETLIFEKSETPTFEKTFSLVKYKLNEYTYQFKIWKDHKCYQIDMNWGRFIALKHFNKNVIIFDSTSNKLAIPIETPLPRLLSESLMLLSGLAPDFKEIDGKKYRVYENVIGIFTQNLFKLKLGQIAINRNL